MAYVCHLMHYTGHHIHNLWEQYLEFLTLHALYSVHHTHYIWKLISSVWCHIHYMWYITQWHYLWYQTLYVHDIFTLYGITHSVMTTHHCVHSHPLCLILHSKYFWHYTKCSNFMTRSECKSSQPLYVWQNKHYIWQHIHSLWYHTTLWYHTHCIHVIKPRIPVIACTVSGWLLIVYWLYHSIKQNHSI